MLKIIALHYQESIVVEAEEFESASNALGVIEERNHEYTSVGYNGPWSVYLVDGQNWFALENRDRPGQRYDFIRFLEAWGWGIEHIDWREAGW